MKRAPLLFACVFVVVWLAVGPSVRGDSRQRGAGTRPNILLITVDDLNWDSLGVTGSPVRDVSPNVDRLAHEGIRFTKAHVTVAICSRAGTC